MNTLNFTFNFNAPVGQNIAHVDRLEAHFDKDMTMQVVDTATLEASPRPLPTFRSTPEPLGRWPKGEKQGAEVKHPAQGRRGMIASVATPMRNEHRSATATRCDSVACDEGRFISPEECALASLTLVSPRSFFSMRRLRDPSYRQDDNIAISSIPWVNSYIIAISFPLFPISILFTAAQRTRVCSPPFARMLGSVRAYGGEQSINQTKRKSGFRTSALPMEGFERG